MNSPTFFILALLALLSSSVAANSRDAAKCLALKKKCGTYLQRKTGGVCVAGRYARNQSRQCHRLACSFCKIPGKRNEFPCKPNNVRAICRAVAAGRPVQPYVPGSSRPPTRRPPTRRPTTRPPPSRPQFQSNSASAPKPGCVYSGTNMVVVSLSNTPMARSWTRTTRGGLKGIVFKKGQGGGIDSPNKATTMCYKMKVSMPGDYLATAITAAPHSTEHNDMWVSSSLGFKLIRHGRVNKMVNPGQMVKAYQNNGRNNLANNMASVDHDPHAFVVPNMGPGKILTYCISGRSTRYEVYKLIIVKCPTSMCLKSRPSVSASAKPSTMKCPK